VRVHELTPIRTKMDIRGKQPSTWDSYEGVHRGSVGSNGSRVQWDQLERRPSGESTAASGTWSRMPGELRRRRYDAMRCNAGGDYTDRRLTLILQILNIAANRRNRRCWRRQQHQQLCALLAACSRLLRDHACATQLPRLDRRRRRHSIRLSTHWTRQSYASRPALSPATSTPRWRPTTV
jgi:hypothetical protein